MRNNILGAVVYLSTAIVFGGSTALLMLFIKENSDRCHYYNGKWTCCVGLPQYVQAWLLIIIC